MTNHVPLDNVAHKDLRIRREYTKALGYGMHVAAVVPGELGQIQSEYPTFFLKTGDPERYELIALLGFEKGQNLYLGDRDWEARYVPMSIRRIPFAIGFQEATEDGRPVEKPVVHIDLDHPTVSETDGAPLFLSQGGESPFLQEVTETLGALHAGYAEVTRFAEALERFDLIAPVTIRTGEDADSAGGVTGLYGIDEDRLSRLDADALEALHRRGYLQSIYMMLASLLNVPRLTRRRDAAQGR
jgi:hypothetical protein